MGSGSYRSSDWAKLASSRSITSEASHNDLFKSRTLQEKYDPKFIDKRYSLDSEEHPESTPIIIGFDVTGSMGYLAAQIAKESLNEFMMKAYSTNDITHPQLMFAAMGDYTDQAPLQVTQFESDIRIAEQLMDLWLEGQGGDMPEDYQLLWYFASRHTHIDSYERRGKKGYLITIGDADCHSDVTASTIRKVFGDKAWKTIKTAELAQEASEKYELIHIDLRRPFATGKKLDNLVSALPGRVVSLSTDMLSVLPELMMTLIGLVSGKDLDSVLSSFDEARRESIRSIIADSGFNGGSRNIEL
ncbi:MAG: hypothetical protein IJ757_00160 [Clostridiales bacterium]|nr:hypothetical protein [Clostridiales bacterium]